MFFSSPKSFYLKSVLIVDDDESFRLSLKKLLIKAGYQVDAVASLAEAINSLKRQDFGLVISDYLLSHTTSLDLLKHLMRMHSKVKTIIITAYGDDQVRSICQKAGAFRIIDKPVKKELLLQIVEQAFSVSA